MCNMWSYAATFFCSVCEPITAHFSFSSLPEFSFVGAQLNIHQVLHLAPWSSIVSAYNDQADLNLSRVNLHGSRIPYSVFLSPVSESLLADKFDEYGYTFIAPR